ncbi:MAG: hypothetical protein FJZ01_21435 [Candidatus Sericytochromatia bacterium]|nr:hypothetical protein [Candidatus Tanganyikabacteria bacterium]
MARAARAAGGGQAACCKPNAACCKPDAACCTGGGQQAGIGLDQFAQGANPASAGGPAAAAQAASAPAAGNGIGDMLKKLQEMIAALGKQFGLAT